MDKRTRFVWGWLRLALGWIQICFSTAGFVLVLSTGLNATTWIVIGCASAATLISRILYRGRSNPKDKVTDVNRIFTVLGKFNVQKFVAEAVGTGMIVFASIALYAGIWNQFSSSASIAIILGATLFLATILFGQISGAHLNPAVTFGLWLSGRFAGPSAIGYVLSQFAGCMLAMLLLRLTFPNVSLHLGLMEPNFPFLLECVLTCWFMFSILAFTDGSFISNIWLALYLAVITGMNIFILYPIYYVSMNPARFFSFALAGSFKTAAVYVLAPFIGAWLARFICRLIGDEECCRRTLKKAAVPSDSL